MTDEEKLAEDSFNSKKLLYKSSMDKYSYIDGFIAGIKASRPKWHKVADGDLPKEEWEYLVCYETEDGNYRNIFILNYTEYDESLHWCDEAFETYDEGVIAWCEIPKYTEE